MVYYRHVTLYQHRPRRTLGGLYSLIGSVLVSMNIRLPIIKIGSFFIMKKRICSKCRVEKDITEFTKNKAKSGGHSYECKSCRKEYRKTHKELGIRHTFKYRYGINIEQKHEIIKRQKKKCAICLRPLDLNKPIRVHMDHNHKTGNIRGVLCPKCNYFLAYIRENIGFLERATDYLIKYDGRIG